MSGKQQEAGLGAFGFTKTVTLRCKKVRIGITNTIQ